MEWERYEHQELYEEGISYFESWLARLPGYRIAVEGLCQMLLAVARWSKARGELAEAEVALDRILALAQPDPAALLWQSAVLVERGEEQQARSVLDGAITRYPVDSGLRIASAEWFIAADRSDDALRAVEAALHIDPVNAHALLVKLRLLIQQGSGDAAHLAEHAVLIHPTDTAIRYQRAVISMLSGDSKTATADFETILDAEPRNRQALVGLLEMRLSSSRITDARQLALRALEWYPADVDLLAGRGMIAFLENEYSDAIAAFDVVLERVPDSIQALRYRAASLRLDHRYDEAERYIDRLLAERPDDAFLLRERGSMRFDQYQFGLSLADFRASMTADPADLDTALLEVAALEMAFDFEAAKAVAATLPQRFPGSTEAEGRLGETYLGTGAFEEALQVFRTVLEGKPNDPYAWLGSIVALRRSRRYEEAKAEIQRMRAAFPSDSRPLLELAALHIDQRQDGSTLAVLDAILDEDGRNTSAYSAKIDVLRRRRRFNEAAVTAASALAALPRDALLYAVKGTLLRDERRFVDAEAAYREALAIDSTCLTASFGLVDLLNRLNRTTEAVEYLQRLRTKYGDAAYIRQKLGWQYSLRGERVAARAEFQSMIDDNVGKSLGQTGLGGLAHQDERYPDAEKLFRDALARLPGDAYAHASLAWALLRQDDSSKLTEASALCKRALELEPNSTDALQALGVIAFKSGRLRDSEDYLKQSIDADPANGAFTDLGALYTRMGRYAEAKIMLTEMLEIDPYYARARIELGNLYLETDRLGDAIVEFRQAQAAEPSLPDAWQALATGLIRAKRHAEAERVLREALRSIDEARCARLHVTLAELLTQIASDSDDSSYYDDSVAEATAAIKIDPSLEDAFMARGVARFKSDDELGALRDFMHCKGNLIAERNARRLKSSFRRALTQKYYGIPIAALALAQLPFLWLEFRSGAIHEVTFATMVPLFMAIIVLAFVLPSLSKFKFSGVEADLTQIREGPSSSGPTGPRNIVLSGPAPSSVSKGPR